MSQAFRCGKCPDKPMFKNSSEYSKHRYAVHVKPKRIGTAKTAGQGGWNTFPIHAKSTEAKNKAAAKTRPVECIPCEIKFDSVDALENHQRDAHGVRFPSFG